MCVVLNNCDVGTYHHPRKSSIQFCLGSPLLAKCLPMEWYCEAVRSYTRVCEVKYQSQASACCRRKCILVVFTLYWIYTCNRSRKDYHSIQNNMVGLMERNTTFNGESTFYIWVAKPDTPWESSIWDSKRGERPWPSSSEPGSTAAILKWCSHLMLH